MLPSPRASRCHSARGRSRLNSQTLGFIPNLEECLHATFHDDEQDIVEEKQRRESTQIPMANILQELTIPGEQIQNSEQKKELHESIMCALDGRRTPRFVKKKKRKKNMNINSLKSSLVEQVRENEQQKMQTLMARNKKVLNELSSTKQSTPTRTRHLTDSSFKRRQPPKDIQKYLDMERSKTFAEYSCSRIYVYPREMSKHFNSGNRGQKAQGKVTKASSCTPKKLENVNKLAVSPLARGKSDNNIPTQKKTNSDERESVDIKRTKKTVEEMNKERTIKERGTLNEPTTTPNKKVGLKITPPQNIASSQPQRQNTKLSKREKGNSRNKTVTIEDRTNTRQQSKSITSTAIVHEFIKHALGVAQEKSRPSVSALSKETFSQAGSRPGTRQGVRNTPLPWIQNLPEALSKSNVPGGKVQNIPGLVDRPFKQSCEDTLWMISPTPEYVLKSLIGVWLRPFLSDDTDENYVENLEKREKYAEAQRSKLLWIRAYMQRLAAMV